MFALSDLYERYVYVEYLLHGHVVAVASQQVASEMHAVQSHTIQNDQSYFAGQMLLENCLLLLKRFIF